MFSFFRRTPDPIKDFSRLKVDMHAHWLPGLDDGAQSMDDSLLLIRELHGMGYEKLIATPHVMADLYPNSSATIRERLEDVREAVRKANIPVELDTAAEYLMDEGFQERLNAGDLLTLPGKRVLVEYSFVSPPPNRDRLFFELVAKGYTPVLAHPERYRYLHHKADELRRLVERGGTLQVNLLSLSGYYGNSIRKAALELIDGGLVGLLGTDAHHDRHLAHLRELVRNGSDGQPIAGREWNNHLLSSRA